MTRTHRSLLALGAAMGFAGSALAADVVRDTWLDGTRTDPAAPTYSENGTDSDTDLDLESAWFRGGAGTLAPVAAGGPLRATAFGTSSATWTSYFTPEASPVTLSSVGDSIVVTWIFTPTNVNATNASQNFRIALVDSPAVSRISSEASPATAAYTGYGAFANMGQTLGHNSSFQLVERAAASGALLSGSGDWTGLINGATNGNAGYAGGTEYTFQMTLTRGAGDVMDILMTMAGGNLDGDGLASAAFSDVTPSGGSFSFDTFSIRPSNTATTAETFDTRLFRVEYNAVPEPATGALLSAGAALLGFRRRK